MAMFIDSLKGIFVNRFCTSKDMRYLLCVSIFWISLKKEKESCVVYLLEIWGLRREPRYLASFYLYAPIENTIGLKGSDVFLSLEE